MGHSPPRPRTAGRRSRRTSVSRSETSERAAFISGRSSLIKGLPPDCVRWEMGYGLDSCQQYRNIPYIGVLKPEVYAK